MKKNNEFTAKVNKEIGGYDYRGYHIDRDKKIKSLVVTIKGDEIVVKTLGEAKKVIDEVIVEMEDMETRKIEEIHFVSKGVLSISSLLRMARLELTLMKKAKRPIGRLPKKLRSSFPTTSDIAPATEVTMASPTGHRDSKGGQNKWIEILN